MSTFSILAFSVVFTSTAVLLSFPPLTSTSLTSADLESTFNPLSALLSVKVALLTFAVPLGATIFNALSPADSLTDTSSTLALPSFDYTGYVNIFIGNCSYTFVHIS